MLGTVAPVALPGTVCAGSLASSSLAHPGMDRMDGQVRMKLLPPQSLFRKGDAFLPRLLNAVDLSGRVAPSEKRTLVSAVLGSESETWLAVSVKTAVQPTGSLHVPAPLSPTLHRVPQNPYEPAQENHVSIVSSPRPLSELVHFPVKSLSLRT